MLSALMGSVLFTGITIQRCDIIVEPDEPLPLGGYTERGNKLSVWRSGADLHAPPLRARVVVAAQPGTRVAVVSVDLLTVPESLQREVAKRLPNDVLLFLTATHTHSAPDSQMLNERSTLSVPGIANFRPSLLTWYADRIAGCVSVALGSRPERVAALQVYESSVALNRGRRQGAAPDRLAVTVQQPGGADAPFLWLHYAAHPVIYGPENLSNSGDWPGRLANSFGMVLAGAIGDVSPAVEGTSPQERVVDFERKMVHEVKNGYHQAMRADRLAWSTQPVTLATKLAHPDFAKRNRIPEALAQNLVSRFAPDAANVSAFRIGKLAVVGIPGEPTSHLGRMIRDYGRRIGFKYVLVCSHVNGWMGYILDPEDYDRGGYEATLSFYGRQQGLQVVVAAKQALDALRGKKR